MEMARMGTVLVAEHMFVLIASRTGIVLGASSVNSLGNNTFKLVIRKVLPNSRLVVNGVVLSGYWTVAFALAALSEKEAGTTASDLVACCLPTPQG